jgi:hypothetical protein
MKKIVAIFSMLILLFQAGGFALRYFVLAQNNTLEGGVKEIFVDISMPYQNDCQASQNFSATIQKENSTSNIYSPKRAELELQTSMDSETNGRDRFLVLAERMNEFVGDENSPVPASKKLLVTLMPDYCERVETWVFYIIEWPLKRLLHQHLILSTINYQSDVYSPPRKA